MPILKSTGAHSLLYDQLSDEGILDGIGAELPALVTLDEAQFGQAEVDAARIDWGAQTLKMEQNFSQHIIAATATSVGFPKGKVFSGAEKLLIDPNPGASLKNTFQSIGGTWNAIGTTTQPFSWDGRLADAMQGTFGNALEAVGFVSNLARDIVPVVGTIVKTLSFIIKLLGNKEDDPDEDFVRLTRFSPSFDRQFANQWVLTALSSAASSPRDWTRLWSPPGEGQIYGTHVKTDGDDDWGTRIIVNNNNRFTENKWAGGIPLSANVDLGWEISNNGAWASGTRSRGALLPSGKDQLPKLWAMALRPGAPAAFCVDTSALEQRWMPYLINLRTFLHLHGAGVLGGLTKEAAGAFVNGVGRDYYGWGSYDTALTSTQVQSVTSNQLASDFGLHQSSLMQAIDQLAKVQRASIDTVACAYVDDKFVAIKPGQPLHSRWNQNRIDLLQHQMVCQVDLESVPDPAYRSAVQAAQTARGCSNNMMLSAGPSFRPNAPTTPRPAPGLNGLITATQISPGGGGGGGGAMLLAAAALGFLMLKNKR